MKRFVLPIAATALSFGLAGAFAADTMIISISAANATSEKAGGMFLQATAVGDFASELIGRTVYDRRGDEAKSLGEIRDLIVADDGRVSAVLISVGGFLGIGHKDVAVSFDALEITTDNDGYLYVILATTKEDLEAVPGFDYDTAQAPAIENVPRDVMPKQDKASK